LITGRYGRKYEDAASAAIDGESGADSREGELAKAFEEEKGKYHLPWYIYELNLGILHCIQSGNLNITDFTNPSSRKDTSSTHQSWASSAQTNTLPAIAAPNQSATLLISTVNEPLLNLSVTPADFGKKPLRLATTLIRWP
jgi:hypothetical protein